MRGLCAFAGTLFLSSLALAQDPPGSPAVGHELARQECAECHAVERDEVLDISGGIPAFQEVADNSAMTETALRVFLQTTHHNMPNFILKPTEVDDIVAYILSLK